MKLDFSGVWDSWSSLLHGTMVTVEITAASLVLGCVLGLLVGLGRLNPQRRVIYGLCTFYLTLVRGTPLLVQLFLWFFGLPHVGLYIAMTEISDLLPHALHCLQACSESAEAYCWRRST